MSTKYIVEIDLRKTGDFGTQQMGHAARAASHLDSRMARLKEGWSNLRAGADKFLGMADRMANFAVGIGKTAIIGGTIAAIGGLTYAVAGLNKAAEGAQVALGAIFNAQGISSNIDTGIARAGDVVQQMRKDAASLPGEFEDLRNIFVTGAIPAFQAGLTPDAFRNLSSQIMAAGAVSQLPMDMVAREAAQLLSGRSGAHNVFGTRIMGLTGGAAEEFNKLSPEKRISRIQEAMGKYQPVIAKYANTFDAMWTTAIDNGKQFARVLSEPLFNLAKDGLSSLNNLWSENQPAIERWAGVVGLRIRNAFQWGWDKIQEWWPAVSAFAENAWTKMAAIWVELEPYVARFAKWLQEALKDPGTIDKLITLAKMYIGFKLATGIGAPMAQGFMGLNQMMGGAGGMLGGAGAAAAPMAFGAPMAATAPAMSAILALGGVAAAAWQFSELLNDLAQEEKKNAEATAEWADRMVSAYTSEEELILGVTASFQDLDIATSELKTSMLGAAAAAADVRLFNENVVKPDRERRAEQLWGGFDLVAESAKVLADTMAETAQKPKKGGVKHPGGGGGTSIAKVEIVVTSNHNPNRIARTVVDELGRISRIKHYSPGATNYAAGRPT